MPMLLIGAVCIPVSRRSMGVVGGSPGGAVTRLAGARSSGERAGSGDDAPGRSGTAGRSTPGGLLVGPAHPDRVARNTRHTTGQSPRMLFSFTREGNDAWG